MSQRTHTGVNLEVIVPHIVLPPARSPRGEPQTEKKQADQSAGGRGREEERERVRLLPAAMASSTQRGAQHDGFPVEVVPGAGGDERFSVYRLSDLPAQGQAFVLQVTRGEPAGSASELAFAIEFRRENDPPDARQVTAGLNRVVIILDGDGRPGSYSIDGAEIES